MEQLELKIYNPTDDNFLKAIEWNFEELKKELIARSEEYKTIVYTSDEQIKKEAKADRAKLRKLIDAMENERKRIKKQYMEPVTAFEKQVRELTGIVDEAVENIDCQIKAYEENKRAEKLEKVKQIYEETIPREMRDFIPFEVALIDKYLLASTTLKTIKTEMQSLSDKVVSDVEVIKNLPEYSFEALEKYKKTLDLQMAMRTVNDLRDTAERKRMYEEQKKAQQEAYQKRQAEEAEKIANANRGFTPVQQTVHESEQHQAVEMTGPEERVLTLKFKVTARESQFGEVNRILGMLKNACMNFEAIKED